MARTISKQFKEKPRVQTTIRLRQDLLDVLKSESEHQNRSAASIIEDILVEGVGNLEKARGAQSGMFAPTRAGELFS